MTNQKALDHLSNYAEGHLDPDDMIEVDALIEQYLEGMLDPELAAEIERALSADARLANVVEEARRGGTWLDGVLTPKALSFLEQPLSPSMAKFTEDVIAGKLEAGDDEDQDDKIVPFQASKPQSQPTRRPWLMAASIAGLLIAGGAGAYIAKTRLDEAASRQLVLEQEINQLAAERDDQQSRIGELDSQVAELLDDLSETEEAKTDAESQISDLESQQTSLEQQVADLESEISTSTDRARQLDQQRAALAREIDRLQTSLTETEGRFAETSVSLSERDEWIAVLEQDLEQQRIDLAEAVTSRDQTQADLSGAEAEIAEISSIGASLEEQVTALRAEGQKAETRAEELIDELKHLQADLDQVTTARDQLFAALSENQRTATLYEERLTGLNATLADAEGAREQTLRQLVDARSQNSKLWENLAGAQQQLATLALQEETITATLADRDRQLAAAEQQLENAEAEVVDARQQIAQLAIDQRDLEARLAGLQQQPWPSQVADYHQYFATQPQRRWAEVSSQDSEAIRQYLADLGRDLGLERPVPLPEAITDAGLKFVGGRTLVINGMPVAQLGYMDSQKRLLAFCFMRNPSGEIEPIRPSREGDLRMLAWRDPGFQYVVIGYESIGVLGKIAGQLERGYDLET